LDLKDPQMTRKLLFIDKNGAGKEFKEYRDCSYIKMDQVKNLKKIEMRGARLLSQPVKAHCGPVHENLI
jgi:hypothetical protein